MSTTDTQAFTLQSALDEANPHKIADALRQLLLGTMLASTKKQTITLGAVANTVALDPPAMGPAFVSCRVSDVTGGTAAAGPRHITDVGGAASAPGANGPGIATLSDDGKTLTFEGTVKAVVVSYVAAPATALSAFFESQPAK